MLSEVAKAQLSVMINCINLGTGIVPHGSVDELLALHELDANGIANAAKSLVIVNDERTMDEEEKA